MSANYHFLSVYNLVEVGSYIHLGMFEMVYTWLLMWLKTFILEQDQIPLLSWFCWKTKMQGMIIICLTFNFCHLDKLIWYHICWNWIYRVWFLNMDNIVIGPKSKRNGFGFEEFGLMGSISQKNKKEKTCNVLISLIFFISVTGRYILPHGRYII